MAFDIKDLVWDGVERRLSGLSRPVSGDPYQLRVYVPEGFILKKVELPAGLSAATASSPGAQGQLIIIDCTTLSDADVSWSVLF